MNICVYGASSNDLDKVHFEQSYALGSLLAIKGHTLVFGAGNHGVMGSVARGAHDNGGKIIGISPRFFDYDDILYAECTELIFTETMRERKEMMENTSDAFVMAPGGIGTFEEFFEVLTLKQLNKHSKPIAVLNVDGYYNPMLEMLRHSVEKGFMGADCMEIFKVFDKVEDVINYLEEYTGSDVDLSKLKY